MNEECSKESDLCNVLQMACWVHMQGKFAICYGPRFVTLSLPSKGWHRLQKETTSPPGVGYCGIDIPMQGRMRHVIKRPLPGKDGTIMQGKRTRKQGFVSLFY